MPRPNWFLAFPIDGRFVLDLPPPPPALRRFHPDDIHLTLAFLGGCGEPAALAALTALDERLNTKPLSVLTITLSEVVPMGSSRRRYTALSALLGQGRADAAAMISELRDPLTEIAAGRREKRPAKPHVTVARPKGRATDADRDAGLAWANGLDLTRIEARLERIALYTWNEVRRERLFRVVAERHLR